MTGGTGTCEPRSPAISWKPPAQERLRELFNYDPDTGQLTWRITRTGSAKAGTRAGAYTPKGYLVVHIGTRGISVHRVIWCWMTGQWPERQIDHINGIKNDNRWANLREATGSQNCANTPRSARNRTGYKGVVHHESGRFQARIMVQGKSKSLGVYKSPEEAAIAYNKAAKDRFGEFAYQNKVPV